MKNFIKKDGFKLSPDGKKIIKYVGKEKDVVIPAGVEEIAPYAFYNDTNIVNIIMPDSVKLIGDCAFF